MGQKIITEFKDFKRIRRGDVKCALFDTDNGYFDASGCVVKNRGENTLTCECDKTGAVGVIVVPFESNYSLNIFSALAIAFNCIFLGICVVFLSNVPENYSLRTMFRFHLCSALLFGQAVLIASTITVRSAPVLDPCNSLIGFLLQYSFLVAAVFIGLEAVEALKQTFLISLSPATSGKKRFILLGYGIPLLLAVLCFGLKPVYIGSYQLCLVEHRDHLLWISAVPFIVAVGLCLIAAVAALLRLACLSEDQAKTHATRLRSYCTSCTLLAMIIALQWASGHLVQIEGTGLKMAFLFFFITLLQGPLMLLLFIVFEHKDRKAMARGLARGEGKIGLILADWVRPPVSGKNAEDDDRSGRSLNQYSSSENSRSNVQSPPLRLRERSEPPVV